MTAGFFPTSNVVQKQNKHFCLYKWFGDTLYKLLCFKHLEPVIPAL